MHFTLSPLLLGFVLLTPGLCVPWLQDSHTSLIKRGEPKTGKDLPDTKPHPNKLDKVETAFNDALELVSYVLTSTKSGIDSNSDIFTKYFDKDDRAKVKKVFLTIATSKDSLPKKGATGNDLLDEVFVQTKDPLKLCDGNTLAYFKNNKKPYLVLCPDAFKKKAVTSLKGSDPDTPEFKNTNIVCESLGDTVSYRMNSLGMTLLHEYMHFDEMLKSVWGAPIIDQDDGYGPVNVRKLPANLARLNADSYAYYASEVLWTVICNKNYEDPVPDVDDADPDCGDTACQA